MSTRSFLAWHIAGFPIDGLDRFLLDHLVGERQQGRWHL
jgi:hypothetical protein